MTGLEFDYIIVGAGSAGCVLADRLSRDVRHRVLVLEAGGSDNRFWIKVPLGYGFTFRDPRVTWAYMAQPDPGLDGRTAYWPRGRVVGGSSSINAMAYVRGLAQDFDDWESAGARGWGWSAVRDTYARMEQRSGPGPGGRPCLRGDGPLRVSDLSAGMHPFSARFFDAARDMGWPVIDDMNGDAPEGLAYFASTVKDGVRCSAADAFLKPALKRGNVALIKDALVERLVFEGRRVTGVRYARHGRQHVARARAEVILSAGAINSPQLLQLSGLGPAALLRGHGIEVVQDLGQVGSGLQDHLAITFGFAATEPTLNNRLGRRWGQGLAGLRYLLSRTGPLSVPVNQVGGFVRSGGAQAVPDMQLYCNPASYSLPERGVARVDRGPGFILSAQPCRPTSRGTVRIAAPDPTAAPEITPNSLATEADQAQALRACKLVRRLAETPTVAALIASPKGADVRTMSEDEMLAEFRARAATNYHPSCTCRMGRDATDSVLDARLRVHGIAGLRVVDASAFPNITSGNTNAPTMMLAMRAAELIVEDARRA